MSLPTPHIQALSAYKTRERASSLRNISSPYSLAIPPKRSRRSKKTAVNTEIPNSPTPTSVTGKSCDSLQVPETPKKAIVVTEKPLSPYSHPRTASLTVYDQYGHASPYIPNPRKSKFAELLDDRILALSVTLTLAVLLAIAIPLGIILPQKMIKPLPVNVLVPLYIYPIPGVWDRMYQTFIKYPETKFTVIVNPSDGPGSSAWPSGEYINAMKALRKHQNVQSLGYIDTAGGSRDKSAIHTEIATYSGWINGSDHICLDGIFFDKTPWKAENDAQAYLADISDTVRLAEGFNGVSLVAHNPGRVPDAELMESKPDLTVIFEGNFEDIPRGKELHDMLKETRSNRQDHAMLIRSVPLNLGRPELRKIVEDIRRDVEWLYLTDLTWNVYKEYGSLWEQWLDLIY